MNAPVAFNAAVIPFNAAFPAPPRATADGHTGAGTFAMSATAMLPTREDLVALLQLTVCSGWLCELRNV